jgi:hypothetical protein
MHCLRVVVVFLASLSLLGCVTTQPLSTNPAQLAQDLQAGDRVELVTKSGQRLDFKVERIDSQGLHGGGNDIAFTDIENVSRKKVDAKTTSLIVLGVAAVVGIAAAAGGGGSGGGGY